MFIGKFKIKINSKNFYSVRYKKIYALTYFKLWLFIRKTSNVKDIINDNNII